MPKPRAVSLLFSVSNRNGPRGVETVNGTLTLTLTASGVVPGIDAEFFHSGEESRAVDAYAHGGPIDPAHAPPRFSQRPHDGVPLFFHTLIGNGAVSVECLYGLFHNAGNVVLICRVALTVVDLHLAQLR